MHRLRKFWTWIVYISSVEDVGSASTMFSFVSGILFLFMFFVVYLTAAWSSDRSLSVNCGSSGECSTARFGCRNVYSRHFPGSYTSRIPWTWTKSVESFLFRTWIHAVVIMHCSNANYLIRTKVREKKNTLFFITIVSRVKILTLFHQVQIKSVSTCITFSSFFYRIYIDEKKTFFTQLTSIKIFFF